MGPKVRIAKHNAGCGVAVEVIGKEYVYGPLHHVRVSFPEGIAEPARRLELGKAREPLRKGRFCTLAPLRRCSRTIPGGRVYECEPPAPFSIGDSKRLSDTAPHRAPYDDC